MNYIFFDIECANCQGGQAKICSFGYVVTDERLEVTEKEDWIINPKAPFMLTGHRNRPFIKLAYEKEEFKQAPSFPKLYDRIKALFRRPDSMIFGYAADNDAGYLKCEFLRYSLPSVNFTYYDLQKILHFAIPEAGQNQVSLSKAAALFTDEEINQDIHKSDEDAFLSMLVLKGLSKKLNISPKELTARYPVSRGDLIDNQIFIRTLEGQHLCEHILGDKSDRIPPKSENRILYQRFIRHVRPSGTERPQWLKGKRVCIPEKYAERHFRDTIRLIQLIADCGGRYTLIPEECHCFIAYPVYNDDGSTKTCTELLRIRKKHPNARPKTFSPAMFYLECGLTEEEFKHLMLPEIRYLLEERYAPQERKEKEPLNERPRRIPPKKRIDSGG